MARRPHEIITSPQGTTSLLSHEGLIRRRFERRLNLLQIPEDLTGYTVLDIGAWHGFFSFECERRGADRVVAIDRFAWDKFGMKEFLNAKDSLGSNVEYHHADVHELDADTLGTFDLVLFLGVFYHHRNPLQALENIRSITKQKLKKFF